MCALRAAAIYLPLKLQLQAASRSLEDTHAALEMATSTGQSQADMLARSRKQHAGIVEALKLDLLQALFKLHFISYLTSQHISLHFISHFTSYLTSLPPTSHINSLHPSPHFVMFRLFFYPFFMPMLCLVCCRLKRSWVD
jgi:hypothetical protein